MVWTRQVQRHYTGQPMVDIFTVCSHFYKYHESRLMYRYAHQLTSQISSCTMFSNLCKSSIQTKQVTSSYHGYWYLVPSFLLHKHYIISIKGQLKT